MYFPGRDKLKNDAELDLPLMTGQRMQQEEFHRLYEQMPLDYKVELVNGVVFVAEPAGELHAECDNLLATVLGVYAARTAGVKAYSNGTVILDDEDEVQPDSCLCIRPECGGQTRLDFIKVKGRRRKKYVFGAPELVVEVADSTRAIDLGTKRFRYAKAGVKEYAVFRLEPESHLYWFSPPNTTSRATDDGIFRSEVFPGLWINAAALIREDNELVLNTVEQGLASPEHLQFIATLKDRQS
jgi:Uma2 family endonuclease